MVLGYLILRCDSESWKRVRICHSHRLLRPILVASLPIYVVSTKEEAVLSCRNANLRQDLRDSVYYYYPVDLFGYETNS